MQGSRRIHLLGPVLLEEGDRPLTGIRSRKALALLGYVAVHPGPVARSVLAALFWEDIPESRARANLSWVLNLLKSHLPGCLHITRHTVACRPDRSYWLDVHVFPGLAAQDRLSGLAQAAALYRGPFLDDILLDGCGEFEIWLVGERERWRLRTVEVLQRLADGYRRRGAWDDAVQALEHLRRIEPWREETYRQLMALYAEQGERSQALALFQRCREVLAQELGVEPSAETTALYTRIRQERRAGTPSSSEADLPPPHNLPRRFTPFVGRSAELARLRTCLQESTCALLTITGPGGMGKTRLAVETAAACLADFPDGAWFVPLEGIDTVQGLIGAVAAALDLPLAGRSAPRKQLLDYLRNRRLCLVLDGFDRLVDKAELLLEILEAAPQAKILVTSRQRLNLRAEWLLELDGLSHPASPDREARSLPLNLEVYEATQLFLRTLERTRPAVTLSLPECRAIAHICHLVEGLPLALELAASLPPERPWAAVAQTLAQNLDLLATEMQDVPARHRSLRAVFDYSWALLPGEQRRALARLSLFRGSFDAHAAAAVSDVTEEELHSLIERSFLTRGSNADYRMHAVIRSYAGEALTADAAEYRRRRDRHCRFYMALLQEQEPRWSRRDRRAALAIIDDRLADVGAAWQWAVAQGEGEALHAGLESLGHYFKVRGRFEEGEALVAAALERAASAARARTERPWRARLLTWQGLFLRYESRLERAAQALQESLALWQELDAEAEQALPLRLLATLHALRGEFAESEALCQKSLRISRRAEDPVEIVSALNNLGVLAYHQGEYPKAARLLEESQRLAAQEEHTEGLAAAYNNLGMVAEARGERAEARRYYEESLALCRTLDERWGALALLNNLGVTCEAQGDHEQAQSYYREAFRQSRELGDLRGAALALTNQGHVAYLRGRYPEARRLCEEGLVHHQQIGHRWGVVLSHLYLGQIALAQEEGEEARRHFLTALEQALAVQMLSKAVEALVGLAEFHAHEEEPTLARRLLEIACAHPACEEEVRARAEALLLTLPDDRPPPAATTGRPPPRLTSLESVLALWEPDEHG